MQTAMAGLLGWRSEYRGVSEKLSIKVLDKILYTSPTKAALSSYEPLDLTGRAKMGRVIWLHVSG